MFAGREYELAKLNELYNSGKYECVIIYGRRRVGKTALILEFIKNKKAAYFMALEASERTNLENFSKSVIRVTIGSNENQPIYANFKDAIDAIGNQAKNERIILAIDEFPYIAESAKGFSSILQERIDLLLTKTQIFIILCGSSMSFMENQVLGYQSPLYGRRTAQLKITPFNYMETSQFFSKYNIYDRALLYGVTGGIPQYISLMDEKKTVEQNIVDNFFNSSSYLFEEPGNLLKQELREPQKYNDIISAIATGSSRLNEIATKTAIETSTCSSYIQSLISLGIVKKEYPIFNDTPKRTIYRLADGMFRFWYRYTPRYISLIQEHAGDRVYGYIKSDISTYMGEIFEDICKQYLWKENLADRLPFSFIDAGRWWGANPILKSEQEIDIFAYDNDNAIFCECKWKNEKTDANILRKLIEKSNMFNFKAKYFYLFSKSGYTNECIASAGENVRLIEFREMFSE